MEPKLFFHFRAGKFSSAAPTNGATEEAREIGELATNVRAPARDVHITPGITETSLMSTAKFSDAGYTTIFDSEHDTVIMVSCAAIRSRRYKQCSN